MKRLFDDSVNSILADIDTVDVITRHLLINDIGIIYNSKTESVDERLIAEHALIQFLDHTNLEIQAIALQHLLINKPTTKINETKVIIFLNSDEHEDVVRVIRTKFATKEIYSWLPIPNWQ